MNTPLSMLITGAIIATSDLRAIIRSGRLWLILVLRMAVIPAVSFLLCLATGTGGMVGAVVILLEACPCAAITSVFAVQFHYDEQLGAGAVVASTLLSIFTALASCWSRCGGGLVRGSGRAWPFHQPPDVQGMPVRKGHLPACRGRKITNLLDQKCFAAHSPPFWGPL